MRIYNSSHVTPWNEFSQAGRILLTFLEISKKEGTQSQLPVERPLHQETFSGDHA